MTEETGEFEAGRDEEIVLVDAELQLSNAQPEAGLELQPVRWRGARRPALSFGPPATAQSHPASRAPPGDPQCCQHQSRTWPRSWPPRARPCVSSDLRRRPRVRH